MTNLEAADLLDNLIGMVSDNHGSDYDEALSKGRDILKSEPCDDCISRQAVLALITEYQKGFDAVMNIGGKVSMEELADDIKLLNSSVTPQPKTGHWIPVSERLPEKSGEYLVTVKRGYVATGLWVGNAGYWNEVIAWMPLPEPYREVEE